MRCPKCKNFASHAFIDELDGSNVYRCNTVGVETSRTIGPKTFMIHTIDHSDLYFKQYQDGYVEPVRLDKQASEQVLKQKGWHFEKGADGRKIVPVVWTTRRVVSAA